MPEAAGHRDQALAPKLVKITVAGSNSNLMTQMAIVREEGAAKMPNHPEISSHP
jgi:hypothetical protein